MTQKQFIKQLMSCGVSHSDACGLVAYMKELRQLIEKHEDVVMLADALRVMEAWGFAYKTAAFVWIKKYKSGGNFYGMGAYTRANAEVCLLGVTPGFKAKEMVKSHSVHQVIESPIQAHSVKPDETRHRIVELLGDVPRIELFARQRVPGWDAWGDEIEEMEADT